MTLPPRYRVVDAEGFGAVGDAAPLSDAEKVFLKTKMEATVAAMRSAFKVAQAKVVATPNSLIGGVLAVLTLGLSTIGIQSAPTATKEAVASGLRVLENMFETKIVAAMPRVYSGELSADRWFNMVQPYVEGIKSILNGLHEDGTSASVGAVVDGMFKDTNEFLARFKRGVENTFDFMPLIVGGAALLGTYLVVTRLVPKRQLSGYRRKRRLRLSP
jgi:hypothetical protein